MGILYFWSLSKTEHAKTSFSPYIDPNHYPWTYSSLSPSAPDSILGRYQWDEPRKLGEGHSNRPCWIKNELHWGDTYPVYCRVGWLDTQVLHVVSFQAQKIDSDRPLKLGEGHSNRPCWIKNELHWGSANCMSTGSGLDLDKRSPLTPAGSFPFLF
jgi:hypothetical protein